MLDRLTADGIEVRRAGLSDLASVLALWERAGSEHASTPNRVEDLKSLVSDSPAVLLIAERGAEIVGTLIAAWDGWRGNLYRLAVREDCRRRGVGLMLTSAGEQYLRESGARRITALVAYDDAPAGAFWDAAGYPWDKEMGRRVRNL